MLEALTTNDIAARLSGTPAERAAIVQAGAEAGVAEAQAVWGQMLLDRGKAGDALTWFVRAAKQHHVMALNMVGRCYDLGWGTPIDKARAAECYAHAARRGLDWAMYNYATLLALGEGVAEDKTAARAWLEKAVAGGGEARAKALNFVGSFAEDGWAGPRDMAKAARCYAGAAAGGDFRGCFNHARLLMAAGDLDAALPWLHRAGELGHARFVAQVTDYLAASPIEGAATRGLAAVRAGVRSATAC